MALTAYQVANQFIANAARDGETLTHMKIQKLVYYAHGYYLAIFDEPLIEEAVEAWQYGPVIRSLYRVLKGYGHAPIRKFVEPRAWRRAALVSVPFGKEGENERAVISKVWEAYKGLSGLQLSALTHAPQTPWALVRDQKGPIYQGIDNRILKDYFKGLLRISGAEPGG